MREVGLPADEGVAEPGGSAGCPQRRVSRACCPQIPVLGPTGPSFLLRFELERRTSGGPRWSGSGMSSCEPSPWVWLRDGVDQAVSCGVGVGAASGGGRAGRGVWAQGAGGVVVRRARRRPVPGLRGRDGRAGRERRGTGAARARVTVRFVASGDSVPMGVSGERRRARVEARRSESVWVPLSPDEAAVVGEAAGRANMLVGAWVGETAVGWARAEAAGGEPDEAGAAGLLSWRELIAALVAPRAEVATVRWVPVVGLDPAALAGELPDDQPSSGTSGRIDRDAVVEVLRRIDAVTGTAVDAVSSSARRSSPVERSGRS